MKYTLLSLGVCLGIFFAISTVRGCDLCNQTTTIYASAYVDHNFGPMQEYADYVGSDQEREDYFDGYDAEDGSIHRLNTDIEFDAKLHAGVPFTVKTKPHGLHVESGQDRYIAVGFLVPKCASVKFHNANTLGGDDGTTVGGDVSIPYGLTSVPHVGSASITCERGPDGDPTDKTHDWVSVTVSQYADGDYDSGSGHADANGYSDVDYNPITFTVGNKDDKLNCPTTGSFHAFFDLPDSQTGGVNWSSESIAACTDLGSLTQSADPSTSTIIEADGHRQLKLESGLVDMLSDSGTLTIRFYPETQITAPASRETFYTFSGVPTKSVVIAQQTDGTVHYTWSNGGTVAGNWVLSAGNSPESYSIQSTLTGERDVKLKGTETDGDRYETDQVWQVTSGQPDAEVSSTTNIYHTFDDGEKIVQTNSQTYTSGHLTGQSQSTFAFGTGSFNGVTGLDVETDSQWASPTGDPLSTVTYSNSAGTYAIVNPDQTCTLYSYETGTYDPSTATFTADLVGTSQRTTTSLGIAVSGAFSLVANKSTITKSVEDSNGNELQEQDYFYDGTSNILMQTTDNTYLNGNPAETTRDGVVTYSAVYDMDSGELLNSTDEFGVVTTPSTSGNTTTTTTYDGAVTRTNTTVTDSDGNLTSSTSDGLTTTYTYGTSTYGGQKTTATLPSGSTSITETDAQGRTAATSGTGEVATSYSYSATDGLQITTQTTGSRVVTTTTDMMGRTVSIQQPKFAGGYATATYSYNALGQLAKIRTDDASVQADQLFTYNSMGQQQLSGFDMDANGTLDTNASSPDRVSYTDQSYLQSGGHTFEVTKSGQYLPTGLQVMREVWSRMDALQTIMKGPGTARTVTTTISVDRTAQTATVSTLDSEIGSPSVSVYAGSQTLISSQEPFQYGTTNQTNYGYDTNGQLHTITDALSHVTTISYTPQGTAGAGQESTRVFPSGGTAGEITRTYNALGLLDTESGGGTYYKHYGYNSYGELETLTTHYGSTNANAVTTWQRDDGTGLVYRKKDAANKYVEYGYNAPGWLTSRKWARGVTTSYGYTGAGEVNSITYSDSTPSVSGMIYDKAGRLTAVTDASGARAITYSPFGDRDGETYTGTGVLSGYAVHRPVDSGTGRRSQLTATGPGSLSYEVDYAYNTLGMSGLTMGTYSAGLYPQTGMRQLWKTTSSVSTASGISARTTYGFDVLGRVNSAQNYATTTSGDSLLTAFGTSTSPILYSSTGRRTSIPREDGNNWSYGYNYRGEVLSGARSGEYGFNYTYDGIGNRLTATTSDAVGGNPDEVAFMPTALNQYSLYGNHTTAIIAGEAASNAQVFVNGAWTVRNGKLFEKTVDLGNESGIASADVTVAAKLLPTPTNSHMVVASQTPHFLSPPANVSPTYDDDGNLLSDGLWNYAWDGENRLKSMTQVTGAESRDLEFVYDFEGRRVQKTSYIGGQLDEPVTRFLYDGWNPIVEANGTFTHKYAWGPDLSGSLNGAGGVGGLLAMNDFTTNKTYSYGYDANGNVTTLTDLSNGSIGAHYEFGPFGELLRASQSLPNGNPFLWSTKLYDKESGLIFYGHRIYCSAVGRWLSRDSLEEVGGINLYSFLENNATASVDPLGYESFIAVSANKVVGPTYHATLTYFEGTASPELRKYYPGYSLITMGANAKESVQLERSPDYSLRATEDWKVWRRNGLLFHDWKIDRVGISYIEYKAGKQAAYGDSGITSIFCGSEEEVKKKWNKIKNSARSYRWASQDKSQATFFPNSIYGDPGLSNLLGFSITGNNSNTFVRYMLTQNQLPSDLNSLLHSWLPGPWTPSAVSDNWPGQQPVPWNSPMPAKPDW